VHPASNVGTPSSSSTASGPVPVGGVPGATHVSVALSTPGSVPCNCPRVIEREMLVYTNREWERLFGYTQAEMRTMVMKDGPKVVMHKLLAGEGFEYRLNRGVDCMLSGQTTTRYYSQIVNKWGCVVPVLTSLRMLIAEDGDLEGIVHQWHTLPPDAVFPTNIYGNSVIGQDREATNAAATRRL